MNAKKAKKLRRILNERLAPFFLDITVRQYADVVVPSRYGRLKNTETGEIVRGALQRRLTHNCPRHVYQRAKHHAEQQRKAA